MTRFLFILAGLGAFVLVLLALLSSLASAQASAATATASAANAGALLVGQCTTVFVGILALAGGISLGAAFARVRGGQARKVGTLSRVRAARELPPPVAYIPPEPAEDEMIEDTLFRNWGGW